MHDNAIARTLASMASDVNFNYVPIGQRRKIGHHVWHGMTCTHSDGRVWSYWLARDGGSYMGAFD